MLYELINPSDPYVFEADSHEVAAITVLLLSTSYGAQPQHDDGSHKNVPIFLFGGAEEWFLDEFHHNFTKGLEANKQSVATALESFMLGHFEDYRRYKAALNAITDDAKREQFIAEWQDGRSSMNDIGTRAHAYAKKIKQSLKVKQKAVMLSVQPMWVEKIASGEMTLEIRKTKPNLKLPFKCFIYESASEDGLGKVVGEFICDKIEKFEVPHPSERREVREDIQEASCRDYISLYLYAFYGNRKTLYAWHISNVKIYESPKDWREYRTPDGSPNCSPQSWYYVQDI